MKTERLFFLARAAMTLLVMMLATTTAWAADPILVTEVPAYDNGQASNWNDNTEGASKLVDGDLSTKYGMSGNPWVEFHYSKAFVPKAYILWTANDEEGKRNPSSWTIKAKLNENDEWTTIATVDNNSGNQLPMANNTSTEFSLENNPNEYRYFHFEATPANSGSNSGQFQLAELQFKRAPGDPTDLENTTITGISSIYFYTSSPISITPTVTAYGGTELTFGTDYTVTIKNSSNETVTSVIDEGDYTLTITGTGTQGNGYYGSQTVNFSVVNGCPEGLSIDNAYSIGQDGYYYVNMPQTGTNTITLPRGFTSKFKVYDNGGKSNDYSKYCSGTLVLTAPTGYLLQLSGSITTQWYDKLTVYDGSTTDAAKLLDGVSSADNGSQTAITTVISSGQSMTLYFYSDDAVAYAGLNLTVTLISANAELGITVDNATGGCVVATVGGTSATTAKTNDVVTLAATPESGYVLSGISVTDASTNPVAVTWDGMFSNTATFTMPGTAVTVTPTFTNDLANIYINMPWTGMQTVAIPSNVTSLKVYDNGGKSGNYSNKCDGTLVLTAPTGYLLQLSGSITTESSYDYLSVYDGSDNSGTKLLDKVYSTSSGTQTAITTVTSSGQSMTLYFYSDTGTNYAGLNLTVTIVPIPWSGSGNDADDPFIIEYPSQLDLLAQRVNDGISDYSGKYFKLGADITYDHNTDWDNASSTENNYKPIGGYFGSGKDRYFKGHFDGANHVISGIRIYRSSTADPDYNQGLFGQINGNKAEVKNIILADARITGYSFSGGIIGNLNGGTVENCHVLDDVTINAVQNSTCNIGGIAGYNGGTVTGCTSAASLTIADGLSSCMNYGGIVGYNLATVKDCLYLGTTIPSGANSVGAIVGENDGGTVTNSYYTDTAINGKKSSGVTLANDKCAVGNGSKTNCGLAHTITLSNGTTLGGTATAHGSLTAYGDFALAYNDGTSTTIYSTAGNTVTLGDAPEGGIFGGYTATNGGTISGNDTDGYTLTMPAADVTVTALLSFTYIDENGVEQTHAATIIDGNQTNLPGGWYVVNSDVALTTKLNFTGDTHLILADGKTLSIDASGDSDPNNFYLGLSCRDGSTPYELTIYGQSAGTGKVTSKHGHPGYGTSCGYIAKTITINGGVVEATSSGHGICGSNVIINGGQIILAPSFANITADNITLSWRKPSDYIQAYRFINPSGVGTITITDGKVFTDGTNIYDNTTGQSTLEHLSNVTLHPCLVLADNASNADAIAAYNGKTIAVALDGRTLTKDGNWNTLCLPFDVTIAGSPLEGDPGENPVAKVFDTSSSLSDAGVLTLNFSDAPATIPAGTPFIIKWTNTATTITNPVFIGATISSTTPSEVTSTDTKVKFVGQYSPFDITADNINEILYVASGNKIGYSKSARTLKCFRAHFWVKPNGTSAGARMINLDFGDGETTSLNEELRVKNEEFATAQWYTLDGRKLTGVPTQKGVYIVNGKKIIIK